MSMAGFLFFGFIIVSYGVGVWVGTKIKQPKIIIKQPKGENQQKNLKNKMGLPPRRR